MTYFELEELPVDIFELISTYLDYHDIAILEQTSKKILSTIKELHLWRRAALTLIQKSNAPAVKDALTYIKKNATMCPKVYKIFVGVTVHTTKIVDELKQLVDSYERMHEKKMERYRLLLRRSHRNWHILSSICNVDEMMITQKKNVINRILFSYAKTLEVKIEKLKICAGKNMVAPDVKYHIDEYKRQTSVILLHSD